MKFRAPLALRSYRLTMNIHVPFVVVSWYVMKVATTAKNAAGANVKVFENLKGEIY